MFDMGRREFITLLGGAAAAWPVAARGQQPERVRRIGVLMNTAREDAEGHARLAVFRQALQKLGWNESHNVRFDYRWAPTGVAQARVLAEELVELQPDLIFANSTPVTVAVKDTTRSIPVVFVQVSDPVVSNVVKSLSRPGGNLNGFTTYEPPVIGKWLELLKSVAPSITRIAYLFNPPTVPAFYPSTVEAAAPLLSLTAVAAAVIDAAQIERTIQSFAREPGGGLLVMPDVFTTMNRRLIISLAAQYRLPALYTFKFVATEGGLMSYGIDVLHVYGQVATYVDRILKGEKPADLPVQAPTKYELVINLKTAKALGLEVPPTLLARADEVIE
jgi:ABC-type uncharacterized transport system substrate-binding protein